MLEKHRSFAASLDHERVDLDAMGVRTALLTLLVKALTERELTQADMARLLDTTQPRVSRLLNGQVEKFSLAFLLDSLFRLGYTLDVADAAATPQAPLRMTLALKGHHPVPQPVYNARDVVRTFIERGKALGMVFRGFKLQKLVYAAHGQALALHGRPLIDEPFCAWKHGPLIESIHYELKVYGLDYVKANDNYIQGWGEIPPSDTEILAIVDDVLDRMGRATADELVAWAGAADGPWHRRFNDPGKTIAIDNTDIQQHFKRHGLPSFKKGQSVAASPLPPTKSRCARAAQGSRVNP